MIKQQLNNLKGDVNHIHWHYSSMIFSVKKKSSLEKKKQGWILYL